MWIQPLQLPVPPIHANHKIRKLFVGRVIFTLTTIILPLPFWTTFCDDGIQYPQKLTKAVNHQVVMGPTVAVLPSQWHRSTTNGVNRIGSSAKAVVAVKRLHIGLHRLVQIEPHAFQKVYSLLHRARLKESLVVHWLQILG